MKYTIDLDTNAYFVQIFGISQDNRQYEEPFAFQARGGRLLLERLQRCLVKAVEAIEYLDSVYHECNDAKREFHTGTAVFEPGEIPVVALIQERRVSMLVGVQQLGVGMLDVPNLLTAINTYLEKTKE